jgi:hypothetical protein
MLPQMSIDLHVMYPLFLSDFKVAKYHISCKSIQCEPSCSMRTDRRTDRHEKKLIIAFRSFAKAPNKTRLEMETYVHLESFAVILLLLLHN